MDDVEKYYIVRLLFFSGLSNIDFYSFTVTSSMHTVLELTQGVAVSAVPPVRLQWQELSVGL